MMAVVDYQNIAEKAVRATDPENVQRFVVCSLVPDLYCQGYNPRQFLAEDSNLARTAARYKVDVTKLAAEVRTELSRPMKKPDTRKSQTKTAKQTSLNKERTNTQPIIYPPAASPKGT